MNRRIIKFFIFFLFIHNLVIAQEREETSVTVNISAEVVNSIDLITVRSIQFERGAERQTNISINPVNDNRAGKMIAQGTPGASFRITFLRQRDLININNGEVLFFRYLLSGKSVDDQGTSELLEDDNRSFRFNDSGVYYIWIGGEADLQNATPGSYQGEFTLEIEYI